MAAGLPIEAATPHAVAAHLKPPPQVAGCLSVDWNEACELSSGGFGEVKVPDDWHTLPDGAHCRVAGVRIGEHVDSLRWLNPSAPDAHLLGGTSHDHLLPPNPGGVVLNGYVTRVGDHLDVSP